MWWTKQKKGGGEGVEGAMCGVVGGAAGATAGGGTGEDDMEVEEITAPNIDDWSWQPAVKEKVGNIRKRLKILETVAWCVRCGKKSGTRKSKDGQWVVLNGHVAKPKKGGRFFPYPSCPEGDIDPKEQKKRAAEIQRKKAALDKIIKKNKKRKR